MIKIHKADSDAGGVLGTELTSGAISEFLPTILKNDMLVGVTTFRKLYAVNDTTSISVRFGIEDGGEFDLIAIFESTGDAQLVGDLTGAETKYGATVITKAIDSSATEETVNGAGSLVDIKKIVIPKIGSYVLYRVGEFIYFANRVGKIQTVTDLGTEFEIELETATTYAFTIGEFAQTHIIMQVPTAGHSSMWVEQYIASGESTPANYNATKLLVDY